jgi:hypothetical protein
MTPRASILAVGVFGAALAKLQRTGDLETSPVAMPSCGRVSQD